MASKEEGKGVNGITNDEVRGRGECGDKEKSDEDNFEGREFNRRLGVVEKRIEKRATMRSGGEVSRLGKENGVSR